MSSRDGDALDAARPSQGPSHRWSTAFHHAPLGIAVLAMDGTVLLANRALHELVGRPSGSLEGGTLFEVTHPEDLAEAHARCASMSRPEVAEVRHECRFVHSDGSLLWVRVSTSRVEATPDHPAELVMHVEDVTDRRMLEDDLRHRALHDPLTGLANRVLLLDRIAQAQARARRTQNQLRLLYLDLDGFKAVNDRHGHAAGDRLLVAFATRLLASVRRGDTVARLGGDEFVIVCEDCDEQVAAEVAERVLRAARTGFDLDGTRVRVAASIGQSLAAPGQDAAQLLHAADVAMYEAKRRRPGPLVPPQDPRR